MQNHFKKLVGGVAFTLILNFGHTQAAVIVSNLNQPVNGSGGVYTGAQPQAYAQEFLTGNQSVALGSIIVPLGAAVQPFTASAELVANIGGIPSSTALTTFPIPAIPTTTAAAPFPDLTFTPNSTVMLSANTDYWFILSATGTGTFRWAYTDTNSPSLPNYADSHNGGATWTVESNGPFLMEVDSSSASAVPEPSTLLLIGCAGVLAFGSLQSRRRKIG